MLIDVSVRTHRILAALTNYENATGSNNLLLELHDNRLGEPIGYYRNPGEQRGDVIGIFANGLGWVDGAIEITLLFDDIESVELLNEKESLELVLNLRDGRMLRMPINGQRDRFVDSLEVLRFLERVIQDRDNQLNKA
jgi:hypothetical protein